MELEKRVQEKKDKYIVIFCLLLIVFTILIRLYANNEKNFMYQGKYDDIIIGDEYKTISNLSEMNSYMIVKNYSEYSKLVRNKNIPDKYNSDFFEDNSLVLVVSMETYGLYTVKEQNNMIDIEIAKYTSVERTYD